MGAERDAAQADDARARRAGTGHARRKKVPRHLHAEWARALDRPDPVELLEQQATERVPELNPIRYGRMLASPFTFFRGAAAVMANDLAATPHSGIRVQACGDAHLMNFGIYATPERNVVFDVNDFDETLAGPWEWDVKRLATSFEIAGRENELSVEDRRAAVMEVTRSYVMRMGEYANVRHLDVWYARVEAEAAMALFRGRPDASARKVLERARLHDNLQAEQKLTEVTQQGRRIKETPPIVMKLPGHERDVVMTRLNRYRKTLAPETRQLLARYGFVDAAQKIVGVGSVGTRCSIVFLEGDDDRDPLFLQIKEAQRSVLEPHLRKCPHRNQGQRVVHGQRLMQAASDLFLGWGHHEGRDYYWRQLRDMKGSVDLEGATPDGLTAYATMCGWSLARAHARSGDPVTIAGYTGTGDALPDAVADFAAAYADQSERDHAALLQAWKRRRIVAEMGI